MPVVPITARVANIVPPDDHEMWSYVVGDGRRFLQFPAFSRIRLGGALIFLGLRGDWLILLLPFGIGIVLGGIINVIWSTQIQPFDHEAHRSRVGNGCEQALERRHLHLHLRRGPRRGREHDHARHRAAARRRRRGLRPRRPWHRGDPPGGRTVGGQLSRATDWGWMKKSGNLRYGYERSSGQIVLVLDADFVVRSDFLEQTLPYFDDDALGILQTPQFFRTSKDNWVERGAAAQQEQFYRIGLRARDRHDGAICVGTNALYRRSALDERGGMALLEHSEDIFTGMKVVDAGYPVDTCRCPSRRVRRRTTRPRSPHSSTAGRGGNLALVGTPLFKRMRLHPMQRLGLWDGWIFYVTSALSPLVALFVPIVSLAQAPRRSRSPRPPWCCRRCSPSSTSSLDGCIFPTVGPRERAGLISQVAHLHALRDHLTDRDQERIPTGGHRPANAGPAPTRSRTRS